MECYSEQMCSIFVDGELAVDEARRLRDHLATCQRCRELVDARKKQPTRWAFPACGCPECGVIWRRWPRCWR